MGKIPDQVLAPKTSGSGSGLSFQAAVICVVLVAIALRPGIASIGPLLPRLRHDFKMSNTQASLLVGIPTLLMGVLALPSPWLVHRFGRDKVILTALSVIILATTARACVGSIGSLLLTTAAIGSGIAICGALMGGFVKANFPKQAALLMGIYAMALGLGSTIAAITTGPIAALMSDWRWGAGIWALPGMAAIAAWVVIVRSEARTQPVKITPSPTQRTPLPLHSRTAWLIAIYLGLTNILFFGLLSWMAPLFRENGASETKAGLMLACFTGAFMLANPLPGLLSRNDDRRFIIGLFASFTLAGILTLAMAPGALSFIVIPMIAAGIGGSFTLAMTLPLDNAKTTSEANAWNAFTMAIGYAMGALGPVLVGLLRDSTGGFQMPVWFLTGAAGLMLFLTPFFSPPRQQNNTLPPEPNFKPHRRPV
jgi:CP family cyanate transporter-like MFS transporter